MNTVYSKQSELMKDEGAGFAYFLKVNKQQLVSSHNTVQASSDHCL